MGLSLVCVGEVCPARPAPGPRAGEGATVCAVAWRGAAGSGARFRREADGPDAGDGRYLTAAISGSTSSMAYGIDRTVLKEKAAPMSGSW